MLFFLPKEKLTRIERRMRGREDARKLGLADCVIVSFGKSGRTWLRVMMSRFYQLKHGLSERHLLAFDNLHGKNPAIPRIFFTHDNYLKDFTGQAGTKAPYRDKKIVLMVRDPADVAVSQYFQWKYRMVQRKKVINEYPLDDNISLYDFVSKAESGLPKVIDFMNGWARELVQFKQLLIVRYEDLRAQPEEWLRRVLEFIGTPGTPDQIRQSVEYASIENMRMLEQKRVFWLAGRRMMAKDRGNLNTYKVRRAKVGGYRDDFTPDEQRAIDDMVASRLLPGFGYEQARTKGQQATA